MEREYYGIDFLLKEPTFQGKARLSHAVGTGIISFTTKIENLTPIGAPVYVNGFPDDKVASNNSECHQNAVLKVCEQMPDEANAFLELGNAAGVYLFQYYRVEHRN